MSSGLRPARLSGGIDPDRQRSRCGAVFWLAAAREDFDDDHPAAAAGTWTRQHARLVGFCCGLGYLWLFWARWYGEQIAGACDIGSTVAIGEQAIVPDAVEAVRQDVDEEDLVGRLRTSGLRRAAVSSERDGCYRTGCSAWRTHDDGDGRSYTGQ